MARCGGLLLGLLAFAGGTKAAEPAGLASALEAAIAGGKDRPRDLRVSDVKGFLFVQGAIDTNYQKAKAMEYCKAYAAERARQRHVPAASLCVDLIRKRRGQPEEPPQTLEVTLELYRFRKDLLTSEAQLLYDRLQKERFKTLQQLAIIRQADDYSSKELNELPWSAAEAFSVKARSIAGTDQVSIIAQWMELTGVDVKPAFESRLSFPADRYALLGSWTSRTNAAEAQALFVRIKRLRYAVEPVPSAPRMPGEGPSEEPQLAPDP
jgi:hypothetical protein